MKNQLIAVIAAFLSFGIFAFADSGNCPDLANGETAQDCPWALISKSLDEVSKDKGDLNAFLKREAPGIVSQLEKDAKKSGLKSLWGEAINFDELAKGQIVNPITYDLLNDFFKGSPRDNQIVNAGLQHTYAYLFSTLKTPYGYKRARWVKPDITDGFKLPPDSISANPLDNGTLFSNITYFAGKIAYRVNSVQAKILKKARFGVSRSVLQINFSKLESYRLVESLDNIRIQTDLVKFPVPGAVNSYLLVYSVSSPHYKNEQRLITMFPVDAAFVARVIDPQNLGENKPIQSRYNAYLPELASGPKLGKRELQN